MSVNFPSRILAASLVLGSSFLFTACGNELVDGDFGGVDLQSFFFDAGSVPTKYKSQEGWIGGQEATFYDFGWAAAVRDTPDQQTVAQFTLDKTKNIPKVALTNPMYFFFDQRGNPLFSAPILEKKTGYYSMPGGKGVRNVNPSKDAVRTVSYPVRERDFYKDPLRNVADYQRPVIDVVFDRDEPSNQQTYTGIWEMVKVTVPNGYDPDSIKSWELLEKGIASGDFVAKSPDPPLVINCPLIDSRTLVIPTVSAYEAGDLRIPQPRVELWYRRKRIDCFLVNGWETLGVTEGKPDGNHVYRLYKATEDAARFSVMDQDVFKFGEEGKNQKRQVVAPMGQLFIPTLSARSEEFYLDQWVTAGSLPRRQKEDPPGYRPIRWWWNIKVTDFGREFSDDRFKDAGLNDIKNIDTSRLVPRDPDGGGVVLNFPIAAKRISCFNATPEADPCRQLGLICSIFQGATNGVDFAWCEEKRVRYGELCAPTVAQCQNVPDKANVVETWWRTQTGLLDPERAAAVPPEWNDPITGAKKAFATKDGSIYGCLSDPDSEIGHCYITCNGGSGNALQGRGTMKVNLKTKSQRDIEKDFVLDSRCGGAFLPGFRCLPVDNVDRDTGGSFCLRECSQSEGADVTDAVCGFPTLGYFSDNFFGKDTSTNAKCSEQRLQEFDDNDKPEKDENGKLKYKTFEACVKDVASAPFPGE